MSDQLSQDQIDDLLNNQADEGQAINDIDGESETGEEGEKDYGNLSSAFSFFNQEADHVISKILNKKLTFEISECGEADVEKLKSEIEPPALKIKIPFKEGLEGEMNLFTTQKSVALLADLMLMGDGKAEYEEDHKDAMNEMLSQVLGAYTTSLKEKMGTTVSADSAEIEDFDYDSSEFSFDESDMAVVKGSIEDAGDFVWAFILPAGMSGSLMKHFKDDDDSGDLGGGISESEMDDLSGLGSDSGFGGGEEDLGEDFSTGGSEFSTDGKGKNIDMLLDVELDVGIELGRTDLSVKRILELAPGSLIELERMAGEPVDLLVNGKTVAKGEVVVVDENFGIRLVSLVSPEERIKSLR